MYVLANRGQTVLALLLAPLAAWWLYRMFREPLIPGLPHAAPASVVQQQRGKVDALDLERGRLVGLSEWRPLTAAEREVMHVLVRQVGDLPEHAAQIDACEVMGECVCGCASIRLYSTAMVSREAGRGKGPGRARPPRHRRGGDRRGRAIGRRRPAHRAGHARELEGTIGGVHDGTATKLPAPDTLRPAGVRHERWDP